MCEEELIGALVNRFRRFPRELTKTQLKTTFLEYGKIPDREYIDKMFEYSMKGTVNTRDIENFMKSSSSEDEYKELRRFFQEISPENTSKYLERDELLVYLRNFNVPFEEKDLLSKFPEKKIDFRQFLEAVLETDD